jgi:WS/DGAT/MGAT family acyltransferase
MQYVQDRIHFAPIFRQKLVQVPFGIDHPYWIDDPDFDIEFHLRHIALPQPGDWRQLCILASRLNSRPLDFSRPLWEAYIIEGLDNIEGLPKGSFAIMVKVHHAAVDGASGQGIFGALHDLSPDGIATAPDKPLTVERVPTTLELMARSLSNNLKRPVEQTKAFYNKAPNMLRQAIKLYRGQLDSGCKLKVPQTRFNTALTPHRVFEGTHFDINDVKFIKNTIGQGTTVNDVMLDIVAGAMSRYLEHHDETPDGSLCAMLPQDIRGANEKMEYGNRVGGLFADLHSDIKDPIERLLAIHNSTTAAKHLAVTMDTASVVQNYMGGFLNPNLGKGLNKVLQRTKLMERAGPFAVNTLITNVPGPNFPLYHAGAQMVSYWGIPPLMDCLGLGHAVFSYCGRISLSASACREMMPDPAFYMECVEASFKEILDAAKAYEKTSAEKQATLPAIEKAQPAARKRKASSSATTAAKKDSTEQASPEPAKVANKKAPIKKAVSKKAPAKKAVAKKAPVKKAVAKKSPIQKASDAKPSETLKPSAANANSSKTAVASGITTNPESKTETAATRASTTVKQTES